MAVTLPASVEAAILAKVESGQYESVESVVETALHLLDVHDFELERRREGAREGFAQIERGEFKYLDEIDEEEIMQRALTQAGMDSTTAVS